MGEVAELFLLILVYAEYQFLAGETQGLGGDLL